MLDKLIKLVNENAKVDIIDNTAVPEQDNQAVIKETSNHIVDGLKSQLKSGNIGGLMSLLNGGSEKVPTNPIVNQIVTSLTAALSSKFSLNNMHAHGIASNVVTKVLSQLVNKVNDPNDKEFDLQTLAKEFGGGGMLGGMLGKMF